MSVFLHKPRLKDQLETIIVTMRELFNKLTVKQSESLTCNVDKYKT